MRVLKEEDYASDVYTEAVAVPAVRAICVMTPELVVFDDSRTLVPGLVTIYRRAPGIPLGCAEPIAEIDGIIRDTGRQIALWRREVTTLDDPNRWLDHPRGDNIEDCFTRAVDRLTPAERSWTEATIERLRTAREPAPQFVHWDLHAFNVLVEGGELSAILDWGDAGFGDPTLNYRLLPATWLPLLLEPYEDDPEFVGRCLQHMLGYALNDVHRAPRGESPYAHTGHLRWTALKLAARFAPSDAWREWLGDGPRA